MFHSYYDYSADKARPIKDLTDIFEKKHENLTWHAQTTDFTAEEWNPKSEHEQQEILNYRIDFSSRHESKLVSALNCSY